MRSHVACTAAEKCRTVGRDEHSLLTAAVERCGLGAADGRGPGWARRPQVGVREVGSVGRMKRGCRRSADGDKVEEVSMTIRRGSSDVGSPFLVGEQVTVCCR